MTLLCFPHKCFHFGQLLLRSRSLQLEPPVFPFPPELLPPQYMRLICLLSVVLKPPLCPILAVIHTVHLQLLLDHVAELSISYCQLLVGVLSNDFLQHFLQTFGHLSLNQCSSSSQCFCGILEFLKLFQFHNIFSFVNGLKVFIQGVTFGQLSLIQQFKDCVPRGGLEQDQHF